jgi:hypothetical protein
MFVQILFSHLVLVKPLRNQNQRPFALLTPGPQSLLVMTSIGESTEARGARRCANVLEKLAQHKTMCYTAGRMADMRLTTGATHWEADVWRGQATRMRPDNIPLAISSLRSVVSDCDDPFTELSGALSWLADQGLKPASLSSMAWALWRSTLNKPFQANFQAKVGRAALYGGRQMAEVGNWSNQVQVDIQGAYPFAMKQAPYASTLMEVDPSTSLESDLPGLARAQVFVPPELHTPPLPRRLDRSIIRWEWGHVEGTWTWRELAMAKLAGCDVTVLRCWAPLDLVAPFDAWFDIQGEGRNLTHGSKIIKSLSTQLWGLFGMAADDTAVCRWLDDNGEHPVLVSRQPRHTPHEGLAHIAAETSSRVRERMFSELSLLSHAPSHVDTDGFIVPSGTVLPTNLGLGAGQWRVKSSMVRIEVRGPQVYRYTCSSSCGRDHPLWHYSTAGVPLHLAPRLFDGLDKTLNVSVRDHDAVLPDSWRGDLSVMAAYDWTNGVRRQLYGPPLVEMS